MAFPFAETRPGTTARSRRAGRGRFPILSRQAQLLGRTAGRGGAHGGGRGAGRMVFEPLEPRLLLNADVLAFDISGTAAETEDQDLLVRMAEEIRTVDQQAVTVHLAWGNPAASVAIVRPWLL